MRRPLVAIPLLLALGACNPLQQAQPTVSPSPGAGASPSTSSGPLLRALWVLSPVGLKLRDGPSSSARQLATVPQGTQVTATEFKDSEGGWYMVDYNGTKGWIAARDTKSNPPQDLVTTHPQLSFASTSAGYYFLYPATWQTTGDTTADIEVYQVPSSTATPSGASPRPTASASSGAPQPGLARMTIRLEHDVNILPSIPRSPGTPLSQDQYELGGLTTTRHTYTLDGGGFEGDIKIAYSTGKAILITFRGASQDDLNVWNETLESWGFSVPPPGAASPSPSP